MCLSFEDARGGLLVVKMSPGRIFDKFAVEDSNLRVVAMGEKGEKASTIRLCAHNLLFVESSRKSYKGSTHGSTMYTRSLLM
jgi:hypothetical protein